MLRVHLLLLGGGPSMLSAGDGRSLHLPSRLWSDRRAELRLQHRRHKSSPAVWPEREANPELRPRQSPAAALRRPPENGRALAFSTFTLHPLKTTSSSSPTLTLL